MLIRIHTGLVLIVYSKTGPASRHTTPLPHPPARPTFTLSTVPPVRPDTILQQPQSTALGSPSPVDLSRRSSSGDRRVHFTPQPEQPIPGASSTTSRFPPHSLPGPNINLFPAGPSLPPAAEDQERGMVLDQPDVPPIETLPPSSESSSVHARAGDRTSYPDSSRRSPFTRDLPARRSPTPAFPPASPVDAEGIPSDYIIPIRISQLPPSHFLPAPPATYPSLSFQQQVQHHIQEVVSHGPTHEDSIFTLTQIRDGLRAERNRLVEEQAELDMTSGRITWMVETFSDRSVL